MSFPRANRFGFTPTVARDKENEGNISLTPRAASKAAAVSFDSPTSLQQAVHLAQTERKPALRPATALQERDPPSTPEARPSTAGAEREAGQAGSKTAPRPILKRTEHRDPAGVAFASFEFDKDTGSMAEIMGGAGIAASRLPSHPGKKSMTAEEHRIILEKRGSIFHGALRVVRRPKEAAAPAKSVRQSLVALQSVAAAQASHTRTPRAARPEGGAGGNAGLRATPSALAARAQQNGAATPSARGGVGAATLGALAGGETPSTLAAGRATATTPRGSMPRVRPAVAGTTTPGARSAGLQNLVDELVRAREKVGEREGAGAGGATRALEPASEAPGLSSAERVAAAGAREDPGVPTDDASSSSARAGEDPADAALAEPSRPAPAPPAAR
ncbi:hypothetical protein T484DRAFT_1911881, partial [Baffinella frigidus]